MNLEGPMTKFWRLILSVGILVITMPKLIKRKVRCLIRTPIWISTTANNPWKEETGIGSGEAGPYMLELNNETHQTIEGFGGCFNELGWIALSKLDQEQRAKVLDKLFLPDGDLRLNLCRLPIGANDYAAEWYSHNEVDEDYGMEHFSIECDRKYLIPYIKEAKQRGSDLLLFASPWSPPTWMIFPTANNYGTIRWES